MLAEPCSHIRRMKIATLIGFVVFPALAIAASMKAIEYERHEFRGEPERRSAELQVFVYDIPYFGACGIFPPFHILNEIFRSGGSEGGMSPGATWQPFQLSSEEYDRLVQEISELDPGSLGDAARYTRVKYAFDPGFDAIQDHVSWLLAVCEKYRDSYRQRQGGA